MNWDDIGLLIKRWYVVHLRRDAGSFIFTRLCLHMINFASRSSWPTSKKKSVFLYAFSVTLEFKCFWCHLFYKIIKIHVSFINFISYCIFIVFVAISALVFGNLGPISAVGSLNPKNDTNLSLKKLILIRICLIWEHICKHSLLSWFLHHMHLIN